MDDLARGLAATASQKGLTLSVSVDADVPHALHGDPKRLRQVLVNLVGNAIKFTDAGEVVLEVGLDSRSDGEVALHFAVSDTGIGIPEDPQESSGMALNYGTEPLWFRLGLVPQAPFGGAGCGAGCYGGVANAEMAYSNYLPGVGDVGKMDDGPPAERLDLGEGRAPVHRRLARAQQVEIRTVQHGDTHQESPTAWRNVERTSAASSSDAAGVA